MRPRSNRIILAVCCSVGIFATLPARGADEGAVEAVLGALREEGVIDDAQYSRIVSKNAASEAEKWWERIAWFGDFAFDTKASGTTKTPPETSGTTACGCAIGCVSAPPPTSTNTPASPCGCRRMPTETPAAATRPSEATPTSLPIRSGSTRPS